MTKIGPLVLHFDRIALCQLSRKLDVYITHHQSSPTAICDLYSVPAAVSDQTLHSQSVFHRVEVFTSDLYGS